MARRMNSIVYMGTRAHVETGSLVHKCAVLVPKIGESGGRCSGQRMGYEIPEIDPISNPRIEHRRRPVGDELKRG